MKPKTNLQKRVVRLNTKLKPINEKQKEWAFEKCFDKLAVRSRNTLFCLECGHSWKDKSVLASTLIGCTCPMCGKELKMKTDYSRVFVDSAYYGIVTTKSSMQVVRLFFVRKIYKKLNKVSYGIREVMQHWIGGDGSVTTMSISVNGLSYYCDQWIWESPMEVRPHCKEGARYDLIPYKIYPKRSILPVIKRNGFKGYFYGLAPHKLFSLILTDSYTETLLKARQIELLKRVYKSYVFAQNYWPSIKICIRNNYIVKDVTIWEDYIDLLKQFKKDLHNPKYICPDNLWVAHDRLVEKKRNIDRKQRLKELREKVDTANVQYVEQKGKFFDLLFNDGDIIVKPLTTVEEFMNEGDALCHCVFTNEYYKKPDSLILSARINNKPIETIELSLRDMSVIQSRGRNNIATKFHNRILNIVQNNIPKIEALLA